MATSTTRLGLRKPNPAGGGDNINVGLDLNGNWDIVDAMVGFFVCTSGTRPTTTAWQGMPIYETDTGKAYIAKTAGPTPTWEQIIGESQFTPLNTTVSGHTTDISNLQSASWASYTPVWTSDGSAPSIGNGSITGAQRKPTNSNVIDVRGKLVRGSTSGNGGGAYFMSVPQGAAGEVGYAIGTWYMEAGGQHYSGTLRLQTATTALFVRDIGVVLAGTPVTLATNDSITWRARYQPA